MKVVPLTPITEVMLISSTVPENDAPAYVAATTYAKDVKVVYLHRVYRSLQAGNVGHTPGATGNEAWWTDEGPTNRWAMLDDDVATSTTAANGLTVQLQVSMVDALCLPDVDANTAKARLLVDGTEVWMQEVQLQDESHIVDAYSYFFGEFRFKRSVLFRNIPPYGSAVLELTLSRPGGTVSCSLMPFGRMQSYGGDEWGVDVGMNDYSYIQFNAVGKGTINQRGYARTVEVPIELETDEVDRAYRGMAKLRAVPSLYIVGDGRWDCLVLLGIGKFRINIPNGAYSRCTFSIQGMTET